MNPGVEDLARLGCERMLIFVAEENYLTVAAKNYYEKLKKSGWKGTIELVEIEKKDHCFHLLDLDGYKAREMSVEKKLWPCASNALPNEPEVRETVHAMTATASVQIRTGNETTN
ncbi:hypothetical protein POTOM_013346 [Populus tomentosa]|uniref:Alpha/beta hydrolase fold-3 domain-containing protein n=1 Tax=Populus tomentosa TaxID=118781 RepID=A0A8X8CYD5_POPTO|nr:hypothetical protein POTOM_013346 [Populus tomentosa]